VLTATADVRKATSMLDPTCSVRRVDDGRPLMLLHPPGDDRVRAYVVHASVCANPECDCTDMKLVIRGAVSVAAHEVAEVDPADLAILSMEDLALEWAPESPGKLAPAVREWIHTKAREPETQAWFRERWRRARGQTGDPDYPAGRLPADLEFMVPFCTVFPWDFDLGFAREGRAFLVEDLYCLRPSCPCNEVLLVLRDQSSDTRQLDELRLSANELRDGLPPDVREHRALWEALFDERGDELVERCDRILELRRPTPVRSSKIGRNERCPCGSGKKYKRCCGA
jgi:hypothetical protein